MTWKHYRNIASAVVKLFDQRKNNITFWTFTTDGRDDYKKCVKHFSKFIDNFKKTYDLNAYVWTGELGEKGSKPHFHMIADVPYVNLKKLNAAWCKARGYHSESAVRLPKDKHGHTSNSVVRNVGACVRYLCKYMSKQVKSGADMGARVCAMTKELANNFQVVDRYHCGNHCIKSEPEIIGLVQKWRQWKTKISDYCTIFIPTGRLEDVRNALESILNHDVGFT